MLQKSTNKHFKYKKESTKNQKTVIAERGQVTIPKFLRDKFGLYPGTAVSWQLKDNKIYLTKENADDIRARIEKVSGILKKSFPYASTDEFIEDIRGSVE